MKPFATLLLACLALAATSVHAATVGDELPAFTLKDQHDKAHTLDETVQRIYASGDRKGGDLVKTAMAKLDQSHLDAQHAVLISEISDAPFFVKSIIRSSFKDRRYLSWLDVKGDTKTILPYRPEKIAVIELENRRIKAIRHVSDADALKQEIAPVKTGEKK